MLEIFRFILTFIIFVNFLLLGYRQDRNIPFLFFFVCISLLHNFFLLPPVSCPLSGNLKKKFFLLKLEFLDTLLSYSFGVLLNCTADDTFSL